MITSDLNSKLSAAALNENMFKKFGTKINFDKYTREELENYRNLLRTNIHQIETTSNFNDLLSNEDYQKDKYMVGVINTKIKEMLGESRLLAEKSKSPKQARTMAAAAHDPEFAKKVGIKQSVAKEFNKADKGTKQLSHAMKKKKTKESYEEKDRPAVDRKNEKTQGKPKQSPSPEERFKDVGSNKPAFLRKKHIPKESIMKTTEASKKKKGDGNLANNYPPYDKVTRGDVIAGAKGEDQMGGKKKTKEATASKFDKKEVTWTDKSGKKNPATRYTRKSSTFSNGTDDKKKEKDVKELFDYSSGPNKGGRSNPSKDKLAQRGGRNTPAGDPTGYKAIASGEDKKAKGMYGINGPKGKLPKESMREAQQIFRNHVKIVNESLRTLLREDEEGKAKAITAASDMVNDFTTWMQRVGQYQTKSMIELADTIRGEFGQAEAEAFKSAVAPALQATLETMTQQREAISHAVAVLAGEATGEEMGGMSGGEVPDMSGGGAADTMNPEVGGDEFGASDAAAGGMEASGRELREQHRLAQVKQKIAESQALMAILSK